MQIDRKLEQHLRNSGQPHPQDSFTDTLFRQPSLVEGPLKPEAYRSNTAGSPPLRKSTHGGGGSVSLADHYYSDFAASLNRSYGHRSGDRAIDEEKVREESLNFDKNYPGSAEVEQQIDKLLESGVDFTSPRDSFSALGDELSLGIAALQQQFRNSNVSLFTTRSYKGDSLEEKLIN